MRKPKLKVTREQFVGAQMANVLWSIGHGGTVLVDTRETARKLAERWDSVSNFRINNPLVALSLEKQLFPKDKP